MDDKIVLYDEETGKEVEFILLATFGMNEEDYIAMIPADSMDGTINILRLETDENGDILFAGIDDEEELRNAAEVYEELRKESLQ